MRARWISVALAALACGADTEGRIGDFDVSVEPSGAVRVRHGSGLSLDLTRFEARRATATYEMQFGAFRIEEQPRGEWARAAEAREIEIDGAGSATLHDAAGAVIGRLEIAAAGESLRLAFVAAEASHNRAAIGLGCDAEGGFLGFGAMTHDVDHRGEIVPVWVSEQGIGKVDSEELPVAWNLIGTRHQSYLAVPTMIAPRGGASYGVHASTDFRSLWDLCKTDPSLLRVEVWEGRNELILSPGPSPLDVVRQQTAHTGRIPASVPDWTFGVWMERVGGSEAVREEVRRLRRARIPVSAIWSEDWRGAKRQGRSYILEEDWRWDRALYPELPTLIEELHALGVRFQAYFNTFISESADVWDEAHRDGHFVKDLDGKPYIFEGVKFEPAGLADLFDPKTRTWVQRELEAALALGVDGWMADFAEWYPADRRTVAPSGGLDPEAAHHLYPELWAEVNRDAIAASGRDDVVVFHRSGYTGSQAKAHVIWAGDQRTSFQADDGLPTIVPLLLGLSVVGFPIVAHDIAGYVSATNPPSTKDLFFRWTSLGALAPVMRTHHGRAADENWRWDRDEETRDHFRRWAELHTRLFPFWKGLALDAADSGAPIVRPLAFLAPGEPRLHGVTDVFALGDDLVATPVLTASTARRTVELPAGVWFTWEGERREGRFELEVPLGELPIFARAGAIVPMLPEGVQSLVATATATDLGDAIGERVVRVWLGANGETRDASGGRFELRSASLEAPSGAGLEPIGARAARFVGAANTTHALGAHTLSSRGLPPNTRITYEVRW